MEEISIVFKKVGDKPVTDTMNHSLENMQKLIRDDKNDRTILDVVRFDDEVTMWVDDEGLLNGSEPNLYLANEEGRVISTIYGNLFFTSANEEGDTIGLNEKQSKAILSSIFAIPNTYKGKNGEYQLYALNVDLLNNLLG